MPVGQRTIKSMNRSLRKSGEARMLVKVVRRVSYPFLGYLFLLLASALLGLFVEALAYRSGWAARGGGGGGAGGARGASLLAAGVGFRRGAVRAARPRGEGDPRHNVSIF